MKNWIKSLTEWLMKGLETERCLQLFICYIIWLQFVELSKTTI